MTKTGSLEISVGDRAQHKAAYQNELASRDRALFALEESLGPRSDAWQSAVADRNAARARFEATEGQLGRASRRWPSGMLLFWLLAVLVALGEAKLNVFVFDVVFGTDSDISLAMSFGLAVFMMFIAHLGGRLTRHIWSELEQRIDWGNAIWSVICTLLLMVLVGVFTVARAKYGVTAAAPAVGDIFAAIKEEVFRDGAWATLTNALADTDALMVGVINSATLLLGFLLGFVSHDPDHNLDQAHRTLDHCKKAMVAREGAFQSQRNKVLHKASRNLDRHQIRYTSANSAVIAEKKRRSLPLEGEDTFELSSLDTLLAEGRARSAKAARDAPTPPPPRGSPVSANVSKLSPGR